MVLLVIQDGSISPMAPTQVVLQAVHMGRGLGAETQYLCHPPDDLANVLLVICD